MKQWLWSLACYLITSAQGDIPGILWEKSSFLLIRQGTRQREGGTESRRGRDEETGGGERERERKQERESRRERKL